MWIVPKWLTPVVLAALITISIGAVFSGSTTLPAVVSSDAAPNLFSGERAMKHLEYIAKQPHPWDSVDNERVLDYILSHGKSLVQTYGADIVEFTTQTIRPGPGYLPDDSYRKDALVVNVAIMIKGRTTGMNGTAIQVSAHYDGVPEGPAATDDGAGCAVMLELASVLASRTAASDIGNNNDHDGRLSRDVMFLFVDAEEARLVGSQCWANGNETLWLVDHPDPNHRGADITCNDAHPHPWSLLPSFAINIEGSGTASSKAMLIRSNSGYTADAYCRYATHPNAISLTAYIYKVLAIGYTDADVYWTQAMHVMDLIWISERWAYHDKDDSVEQVHMGSLQNMGDNILSIVLGVSSDVDFPNKLPQEEMEKYGIIKSDRASRLSYLETGMESGIVYFTLLGGKIVWMSNGTAKALYISLAIIMAFTMPLLNFVSGSGIGISVKTSSIHTLLMLLNLFLGTISCIASFAAFGVWKSLSEDENNSIRAFYGTSNIAWAGIGAGRSILSLFAICCTTVIIYLPIRGRYLKQENQTHHQTPTASVDESDNNKNKEVEHLDQLSRDVHVGIFYYYDLFFLFYGIILPDAGCIVLWQPIFMWIGSLAEVLLRRWLLRPNHNNNDGHAFPFPIWAMKGFISTVPPLLLLPQGIYQFLSSLGYFLDDAQLWYGSSVVDAFCIYLIIPLLVPCLLLVPWKFYKLISATCAMGWIIAAVVCMVL